MSRLPSKAKPARPQGSAVPGREAAGPLRTYAAVRVSVSLLSAGASGRAISITTGLDSHGPLGMDT
jgi:hypothetical protein